MYNHVSSAPRILRSLISPPGTVLFQQHGEKYETVYTLSLVYSSDNYAWRWISQDIYYYVDIILLYNRLFKYHLLYDNVRVEMVSMKCQWCTHPSIYEVNNTLLFINAPEIRV